MWDGDKNTWMVRETGVTIGVPELKGNFLWAAPRRLFHGKSDEWALTMGI